MPLFLICDEAMANERGQPLYSAETTDEIKHWITEKAILGLAGEMPLNVNGKKFHVFLADAGSGIEIIEIYLYVYSEYRKKWDLILSRMTNTSQVRVTVENDDIMFWSQENKLLLTQPAGSASVVRGE